MKRKRFDVLLSHYLFCSLFAQKLRSSVIHASWLASLVIFVAYVSPFIPLFRPLHHTPLFRGVSHATALMCLLATIIQVFVGAPIFASGVKAIRFNGRANMDTLVAFSSSTAYFYSFVALIANIIANTPVDNDDQESLKYSGSDGTNANVAAWGEPVFESPAILIAIVSTINA
jgi:cation transport ATPase